MESSPAASRRPWSAAEDAALRRLVALEGSRRWEALARRLPGANRGGKSCRLRWRHHLHPEVSKRAFEAEEDRFIVCAFAAIGPKWAVMARSMEGRTDGSIKNRWHSHLKKKYPALLAKYLAEDEYKTNVLNMQKRLEENASDSLGPASHVQQLQERPEAVLESNGHLKGPPQFAICPPSFTAAFQMHPPSASSNSHLSTRLQSGLQTQNSVDDLSTSNSSSYASLEPSIWQPMPQLELKPSLSTFNLFHPTIPTATEDSFTRRQEISSAGSSFVGFPPATELSLPKLDRRLPSSWQSSAFSHILPSSATDVQDNLYTQSNNSVQDLVDATHRREGSSPSVVGGPCTVLPSEGSTPAAAKLPPSIQQFADGNFFVGNAVLPDPNPDSRSEWADSAPDFSCDIDLASSPMVTKQRTMGSLLDVFGLSSNSALGDASPLKYLKEESRVSSLETVMLEELLWSGVASPDSIVPPLSDAYSYPTGRSSYFVDLPFSGPDSRM